MEISADIPVPARKMKSSLSRSGRHCLNRLLDSRSTLFNNQYASTEITKQFCRTYARSPLLIRNFFVRQHKFSRTAHSYSSSSSSSSPKNGLIGWYLRMLESRPILTKSVSSSLIYTFADLSSQVTKP